MVTQKFFVLILKSKTVVKPPHSTVPSMPVAVPVTNRAVRIGKNKFIEASQTYLGWPQTSKNNENMSYRYK